MSEPRVIPEDERNIKVLRYHAGICANAVKVEIKGPALKEQAKIFNGAADTIVRLRAALKLIACQDEGCGGNLRPEEIYRAMQRIALEELAK